MADSSAADTMGRTVRLEKWVPIVGTWRTEGGTAKFTDYEQESFPIGIALSNVRTTNGVLRASVQLTNTEDGCARFLFGYDTGTRRGFTIGIGGYKRAFVLDQYTGDRGTQIVYGLGKRENLNSDTSYSMEARVRGSEVQLNIDGVDVLRTTLPHPVLGDQIGLMAWGKGQVDFTNVEVTFAKPRLFVVMQFGEPYDSLWHEVIKPVAERAGFEAYRADDVFTPGVILQDIVRGIRSSQAIVAEVTPKNPNVYYELGYAHALGTPTVLLAEHPREGGPALPFDISGFRCIFYEDAIRGKAEVEGSLDKHLRSILAGSGNGAASD